MQTAELLAGPDGAFVYKFITTDEYKKLRLHIYRYESGKLSDHDKVEMGFEDIDSPKSGEIVMVPDFNNYVIKLIISGDGNKLSTEFPVLENVEELVNHDRENPHDKIGKTLKTILEHLDALGYHVSWKVLNAKEFGVPQDRKRIYIVGTKKSAPALSKFKPVHSTLSDVLENGLPTSESKFVKLLLSHYTVNELYGKAIKDKRGGENNIHSWDIDYKGVTTQQEKDLLNRMLKERRKKKWAEEFGIDWMDGMPLTIDQIRTFYDVPELEEMLEHLVKLKYIRKEHPKKKVGNRREQDTSLPLGYNIVAGKMSFEVSKVLDPHGIAPTLVAMDMQHLFVPDGDGIRQLTLREGLRLFGYPDDYKFDTTIENGYDLLGNTVVVPVIKAVAGRVLDIYEEDYGK